MGRRQATRSAVATAVAVLFTGCVLEATGPSPTDPHAVTTTTFVATTTTAAQSLDAFQACLAGEGVIIGSIETDGLGRPRMAEALDGIDFGNREVLDALETCGPHLTSGPLDLDSDPELAQVIQVRLDEFARCLRVSGVPDYPDPVPDFDGVGSPFPVDLIPWSDPDLPVAAQACSTS